MTFGEDKWDKAYERVVLTEDKTGFKNTQNMFGFGDNLPINEGLGDWVKTGKGLQLIAEKWLTTIKDKKGEVVEIFINPSKHEISQLPTYKQWGEVKGLYNYDVGKLYVWGNGSLHATDHYDLADILEKEVGKLGYLTRINYSKKDNTLLWQVDGDDIKKFRKHEYLLKNAFGNYKLVSLDINADFEEMQMG